MAKHPRTYRIRRIDIRANHEKIRYPRKLVAKICENYKTGWINVIPKSKSELYFTYQIN